MKFEYEMEPWKRRELALLAVAMVAWPIAFVVFVVSVARADPERHLEIAMMEVGCADWTTLECRIAGSAGGPVDAFIEAARIMRRAGVRVILDGQCASSCVVMMDIMRPNACLSTGAEILFHLDSRGKPMVLSADLAAWVRAHGGWSRTLLRMPDDDAAKFWKRC